MILAINVDLHIAQDHVQLTHFDEVILGGFGPLSARERQADVQDFMLLTSAQEEGLIPATDSDTDSNVSDDPEWKRKYRGKDVDDALLDATTSAQVRRYFRATMGHRDVFAFGFLVVEVRVAHPVHYSPLTILFRFSRSSPHGTVITLYVCSG